MDNRPNTNRTFTKFQRHTDNSGEKVSAVDINNIQKGVNSTEDNIAALKNEQFMDKVLFEFNNNLYVNSMFSDDYCDLRNVDLASSKNIDHNTEEQYMTNLVKNVNAEIYTSKIVSTLGEGMLLNDFFVSIDSHRPHGSAIVHYLITNRSEIYPIEADATKTPCTFEKPITSAIIKSVLIPNVNGECPKLYGIAVTFFDEGVENQYGLLNPDISRFESSSFGTTILIRDRALEDKLVKVIEPNSTTNLNYQKDGRLKVVETLYEKDDIKTEDELNYGIYENSAGETEDLLLSITSTQSRAPKKLERGDY